MRGKAYQLGVMQGRLLPKYKGRYQAHPCGYWEEEFSIAAEHGLDLIEFILDFNEVESNPLSSTKGISHLSSVIEKTGVKVKSICADYFMENPLFLSNGMSHRNAVDTLVNLIHAASSIGATDIVVPCVDHASLDSETKLEGLKTVLDGLYSTADRCSVNIALETDLGPKEFAKLMKHFGPRITVNYDTGNSAALGFFPKEEVSAYGKRISDIHLKDRIRGGRSVPLGEGDTDFDSFFSSLSTIDFNGHFIMQAYRDDEGLEIFRKQLAWITPYLDHWSKGKHGT